MQCCLEILQYPGSTPEGEEETREMTTHAGLIHVCEDRQTVAPGCAFQWTQCDLAVKILFLMELV